MDTTLYDLAEEIRVNALDALDVDRQPNRSYVSTGVPAHDIGLRDDECGGVLAVYIRAIRALAEGQAIEVCAYRPLVDLSIHIVRCATAWAPGGFQAPSSEVLAQESSDLMSDIWQIFTGLADLWVAKDLFDCQSECRQVRFGRMAPTGPLGGAASWALDLTIVDPYTCDGGS